MRVFRMKQLREHFLRTLQPFRLAALPMHYRIRIVQTLDPCPRKCADLNGIAVHDCLMRKDRTPKVYAQEGSGESGGNLSKRKLTFEKPQNPTLDVDRRHQSDARCLFSASLRPDVTGSSFAPEFTA
jgi:hypothetical protein